MTFLKRKSKFTCIFRFLAIFTILMSQFRIRREVVRKTKSRFAQIPTINSWDLFELDSRYKEDTCPKKVNLLTGVFCLNNGTQWFLPLTKTIGRAIATDETLDKEIPWMQTLGLESFIFAATKLLLGAENNAIIELRCFGVQTVGASGAFCLGARFLNKFLGYDTYYISKPSRLDFNVAFDQNGFTACHKYRYFNELTNAADINNIVQDLETAPPNAVILLQMVGHNPTGCDLTREQWKLVADVMEKRRLFPFFDCIYQGLVSGDLDVDAYPVRYFVQRGFEMFCAQSFSKNMGLYDEAVGNLLVILNNPKRMIPVTSQFTYLVSNMNAYPSYYGVRIAACIMNNPQYLEEWKASLKFLSHESKERRNLLRNALERIQTPGIWEHISQQVGVFSYSGLNPEQCKAMLEDYHIYMTPSGRISICGISASNVDYIAKAIHAVSTRSRST